MRYKILNIYYIYYTYILSRRQPEKSVGGKTTEQTPNNIHVTVILKLVLPPQSDHDTVDMNVVLSSRMYCKHYEK